MMRDKDYDANTPLLLAVEGGSSDITRHLIEYGSDVNHYNISRVHPLHTACTIGSLEIVKILLDVSAMQVCIDSHIRYHNTHLVALICIYLLFRCGF